MIKKGLKGPTGNATWEVPHEVPHSTMYVRAYALCAKDDGTSVRCAYGNSPGFFEVTAPACQIRQSRMHEILT